MKQEDINDWVALFAAKSGYPKVSPYHDQFHALYGYRAAEDNWEFGMNMPLDYCAKSELFALIVEEKAENFILYQNHFLNDLITNLWNTYSSYETIYSEDANTYLVNTYTTLQELELEHYKNAALTDALIRQTTKNPDESILITLPETAWEADYLLEKTARVNHTKINIKQWEKPQKSKTPRFIEAAKPLSSFNHKHSQTLYEHNFEYHDEPSQNALIKNTQQDTHQHLDQFTNNKGQLLKWYTKEQLCTRKGDLYAMTIKEVTVDIAQDILDDLPSFDLSVDKAITTNQGQEYRAYLCDGRELFLLDPQRVKKATAQYTQPYF